MCARLHDVKQIGPRLPAAGADETRSISPGPGLKPVSQNED